MDAAFASPPDDKFCFDVSAFSASTFAPAAFVGKLRADGVDLTKLRADLAASAPYLPARDLSNALLGAAYARTTDDALVDALCAAATDKAAGQFSQRDVASTMYALGRLGRRDGALLRVLLSRVVLEAPLFHAIEMSLAASGLADLQLAPSSALGALSRAAVPKLDQFGAAELPRLLVLTGMLLCGFYPLARRRSLSSSRAWRRASR